ncbi:hypothetical protein [uncultured Nostoc sp.]|uniref:hypothetical protein n=1 Tax=uncultured Nostoc sp. TaxID=340711 RepID=UPI0026018E13|nr:hypothetical protein [uncultured Nostoc sp.]
MLPIFPQAIASQQDVAGTFYRADVIATKVNVKPLWMEALLMRLINANSQSSV